MSIRQGGKVIANVGGGGGSGISNVDNITITMNSNNEIQTIGSINQNTSSTGDDLIKYDWIGTLEEYESQSVGTVHPTWICYILDDNITTASRNIGEIVTSTVPLTDAGLHLLDGSVIGGNGSYGAFVSYIAGLYNDDPTANYFAQPEEKDWVQPVATASTTAIEGGEMVITASSEYSTYNAWKAMDGIKSGTTATTGWGTNNTSATQWWQLKLPYQIRIFGLKVYHRYDATPANANVVGRFYTSSDMTTPIGDTLNDTSATNWQESTITGIPSTGIITDTLYFQKTGGGTFGGLGEVVITATVVGEYYSSEEVWQQSVTTYGVCGKFVYDSTNNTVRLPKITGFTEGTTDVTALGDLIEAGLPDFDAVFVNHARDYAPANKSLTPVSGAIAVKSDMYPKSSYPDVKGNSTGSYSYDQTVEIRPSISNSIYGNSSTVQPQSIKVLYYIVIATSVKTDIEVDIDEVMTDLNAKVDKADLSPVNVVIETYVSGSSWYRVWSDGWVEQGGFATRTGVTQTVTFPKAFANTNYNVQISPRHTADSTDGRPPLIRGRTTTGFTLNIYTTYEGAYWFACGYGA